MGEDRWAKAFESLSEADKLQLQSNPGGTDHLPILKDVLDFATEKRRVCKEKGWKFKRRDGKVIIIRDLFEKVVFWVQKFKDVGDIAVNYDPVHAALPWAAVRFLLTIAIEDTQSFGAMVEGIEKVSMLITRCTVFERLYLKPGSNDEIGLGAALNELYVTILRFECNSIRFFGRNTVKRILSSAFPNSEKSVEESFKKISKAHVNVDACAKLLDAECQQEIGGKFDGLRTSMEETHSKLESLMGGTKISNKHYSQLEQVLKQVEGPIVRSANLLEDYNDRMQVKDRELLLQWLSTVPYKKHHKLKRKERLEGSCQWLLGFPEYLEWKKSSTSSIIWLRGTAGTGKSVLVSSVIEDLRQEQSGRTDAAPIAYFYCSRDPSEPERANPEEILRSILEQVSSDTSKLPIREPVVKAYKEKKEENQGLPPKEPLGLDETTDLLLEIFKENPVIIVIDALDECDPSERNLLLEALDTIIQQSASLVRVFVSSRNDGDIVCQLEGSPNIFIRATHNSGDIAKYVEQQVSEAIKKKRIVKGKVSLEMKQRIVSTLIQGAQGMFRWVTLQIQQLCDIRRVKHEADINFVLGSLPPTLHDSYEIIYQGILQMAEASQKLAIRTFKVLLCAQERLTPRQLLAAVTIDPHTGEILASSEEDILDICCNMVFRDEEIFSFRFAHLSVREYLERRDDFNTKITHLFMLDRCLHTFLSASRNPNFCRPKYDEESGMVYYNKDDGMFGRYGYDAELCDIFDEFEDDVKWSLMFNDYEDNLASYAASLWPVHCQLGQVEFERSINLQKFIGHRRACSFAFEIWNYTCLMILGRGYFELGECRLQDSVSRPPSPLLVSCVYGLEPIIRILLHREGIDWNQKSTEWPSWYPLELAAKWGHASITKIFLGLDNGFYAKGEENEMIGSEALMSAVHRGQLETTKLLLEAGVDPNASSSQANVQGSEATTPLHISKHTPLYDACAKNQHDITQLLVEAGADIEDIVCGHPLLYAAEFGDERLVETLLAHGNDVNTQNKDGLAALHYAAKSGYAGIIRLLGNHGVDIDAKTFDDKRTALSYAAEYCSVDAMDALIELGADPEEKDDSGRTLTYWISRNELNKIGRNWDAIRLLMYRKINLGYVDEDGMTALHRISDYRTYAAREDDRLQEDECRDFINFHLQGLPIDIPNRRGQSPLAFAALLGQIMIVKLLVACGANVNIEDSEGRTPLWFAMNKYERRNYYLGDHPDFPKVIEFLTEHGAKLGTMKDITIFFRE